VEAKAWYDIDKSDALDTADESKNSLEYSLMYYIDKEKHFAISISYFDGENPTIGLQKQEYSQLSLNIRF